MAATLKSMDYNVAMTFILNNNHQLRLIAVVYSKPMVIIHSMPGLLKDLSPSISKGLIIKIS